MEEVKFTNGNGTIIEIGESDPYILSDFTGAGAPDSNIQTVKGYQRHGSSYLSTLIEERYMNLEIEITGDDRKEVKMRTKEVMDIFNPLVGLGEVTYSNDAGSWKIYGTIFDGPEVVVKDKYPFHQYIVVGIRCPDPFWLAIESVQIRMVDFIGGLTLPFTLPFKLAERGNGGRVTYNSNTPAPVLLDFRVADDGADVVDPKIENEKGEYLVLKTTIEAGQRIIVNTNPKKLSVTLIDTDGSESNAWDSIRGENNTYLQLHKGENVFKFSAASGTPELYLTYTERYIGVGK